MTIEIRSLKHFIAKLTGIPLQEGLARRGEPMCSPILYFQIHELPFRTPSLRFARPQDVENTTTVIKTRLKKTQTVGEIVSGLSKNQRRTACSIDYEIDNYKKTRIIFI